VTICIVSSGLEGAEPAPPPLGRRTDVVAVLLISDKLTTVMYYGDVIDSYKQVTYSGASITISLYHLQAVDPSGKGSATWVLLLHSARFSASSTLSCKSSMLQQSLSLSSNTSCKKRYEVRTNGEVAVFVRERGRAPPLSYGKTEKMDTDHEASSAWTDLARLQKKDPEIGPIVRLQTEYERVVGVKWL